EFARIDCSAKRASESQPRPASSSSTASRSSPSARRGASLRRSSSRECSRRARKRMARARRESSCLAMDDRAMRMATTKKSVGLGGLGRFGHAARDADRLADPLLDLVGDGRIFLQELARVVLALADLLALVGVPGAGLLDDAVLHAQLDDLALARDALVVEDVEIRDLE